MDVVEHLLRAPLPSLPGPVSSLEAWLEHLKQAPWGAAIDRALVAGLEADRLGYAFVGGYAAALDRLLGARTGALHSLAATESGGAHPKAIETSLREGVLEGEKTFATMATHADTLLVIAKAGTREDGKSDLAMLEVPARAPGVTIAPRGPTPFAPEIPHARVRFDRVTTFRARPGDAYTTYLKPFRTIEDTHVLGATVGYLIGVARRGAWEHGFVEGALAMAVAVRAVAAASPTDAANHLVLAGLFRAVRRLVAEHEAEWAKSAPAERERWQRDAGLLMVAEQARSKRTEAAWGTLGSA